jgi:hypothetical protein
MTGKTGRWNNKSESLISDNHLLYPWRNTSYEFSKI